MSTRTSSCTHCGSPCSEHALIFHDNDIDPVSILDDIEKLDQAIHRLHILKMQCYQQLNAVRSSTGKLPNEILLSIFKYFCSFFRPREFPQFILGGVCTHWRNLLNTEPPFWKTIDLLVEDRSVSRAASLLEVFKERNEASFELIQLGFNRVYDHTGTFQQLLLPIRGVSTLSKIALKDTPLDFFHMEDINFDIRDVSLTRMSRGTGQLRSIILESSPPWSTLTVLTLSHILIDCCCDLLLGCPNLIRFSSYEPEFPLPICFMPSPRHARETHFPRLQHLTWHYDAFEEWDNNLLSYYRFPALQHFHWHGHDIWYSYRRFRKFTSLLPQSCRTFQLSCPKGKESQLSIELLQRVALAAEKFICSTFHMKMLSVVLQALGDPAIIPSLTLFRWEYPYSETYDMTRDEFMEITRLVKNAVQGRHETGVSLFTMEIDGIQLPEEFSKQSIYELMGGGIDFKIDEGGWWITSF